MVTFVLTVRNLAGIITSIGHTVLENSSQINFSENEDKKLYISNETIQANSEI